jgi:hypothetical protein
MITFDVVYISLNDIFEYIIDAPITIIQLNEVKKIGRIKNIPNIKMKHKNIKGTSQFCGPHQVVCLSIQHSEFRQGISGD